LPALWIWLAVFTGVSAAGTVLVTIVLALLGWFAPGFVIQRRAASRLHRIARSMPELSDVLVVMVEAGLSLPASLQLAGERMKGPLGDELRIALQAHRRGLG